MNQDPQYQQSQDFKCKDHPENTALFWCKSSDCHENRIFCLNCQKLNKHVQHYNEDVLSIHELNQFLIEKSKHPKGLLSEFQLQFQSTVKLYDKLISGLSYKFCGLEDKLNQFKPYQTQQILDSLIRFDEFQIHLQNNVVGFLQKFQKIIINNQIIFKDIILIWSYIWFNIRLLINKLNSIRKNIKKESLQINSNLKIGISSSSQQNEAVEVFNKLLLTEPYNLDIMYQKGNSLQNCDDISLIKYVEQVWRCPNDIHRYNYNQSKT